MHSIRNLWIKYRSNAYYVIFILWRSYHRWMMFSIHFLLSLEGRSIFHSCFITALYCFQDHQQKHWMILFWRWIVKREFQKDQWSSMHFFSDYWSKCISRTRLMAHNSESLGNFLTSINGLIEDYWISIEFNAEISIETEVGIYFSG